MWDSALTEALKSRDPPPYGRVLADRGDTEVSGAPSATHDSTKDVTLASRAGSAVQGDLAPLWGWVLAGRGQVVIMPRTAPASAVRPAGGDSTLTTHDPRWRRRLRDPAPSRERDEAEPSDRAHST